MDFFFVETYLFALLLRSRVLYWACVRIKDIRRRLTLELEQLVPGSTG